MTWHDVVSFAELPEETGREFVVADRVVALFRRGEEVFAVDGICPHAGGPLAEGAFDGDVVTCPWHGWQFNVPEGRHCLTPQIRIQKFAIRIVEGIVQIEIA